MFIVQEFKGNKWVDACRKRAYRSAVGEAWHLSVKGSRQYGNLTRVIVRTEVVIDRYGQKGEQSANQDEV